MQSFDYFLVGYWVTAIFIIIVMVGRPRKPIDSLTAAIATLIDLGLIVWLLFSRGVL